MNENPEPQKTRSLSSLIGKILLGYKSSTLNGTVARLEKEFRKGKEEGCQSVPKFILRKEDSDLFAWKVRKRLEKELINVDPSQIRITKGNKRSTSDPKEIVKIISDRISEFVRRVQPTTKRPTALAVESTKFRRTDGKEIRERVWENVKHFAE